MRCRPTTSSRNVLIEPRSKFMRKYPCGDAVKAMTAALIVMLRMSVQGQTAAASPNASGQTNNQSSEVNATNTQTNGGQLEQVTVTGYLIPRVGEGPQPVATLNQDFITKQAYQTINDVLNAYPGGISQQNALTFAGNSNSPGTSAFTLKSLPVGSTLVLVDGYRFPGAAIAINQGTIPFVDVNAIPLAAVDRIEILKDGGSATYGSDAIAGVINLITKDEYNGADLLFHYGISQRGDAEVYRASATAGFTVKPTETSKFSVVAAFDYYESSPILATDRGFSNVLDHPKFSSGYTNQKHDANPTAGSYVGLSSGTTYFVPPGATTAAITTTLHPDPDP